MSTVISVGRIKITALNDGAVHLPPMFYPGLDFGAHPELLQDDATYHIPVGCFLIQGEDFTVLVDAGIGPAKIPFPDELAAAAELAHPPEWIAEGGLLPGALAAAGVGPADISTIFLTHLHADHISWVAPGGELFFPNAEVVYGAADARPPIAPAPGELAGRAGLDVARAAGLVRVIDAPAVEIAPCRRAPRPRPHSGSLRRQRVPDALRPPAPPLPYREAGPPAEGTWPGSG